MANGSRFAGYDDTPIYTIKTVVQETGISPATLRAWERRYGVLKPGRSDGGYRLYSERDIAKLHWLKSQVDAGVAISRAVALLALYHQAGQQPELGMLSGVSRDEARSKMTIASDLLDALLAFRETAAEAILSEAFALYPVDTVVEEIIAPTLVEIGERWHRDEATVVQEHFATNLLRRRLTTLFHAYDQPAAGPLAITGAAPAEWHDLGILLVSLALRRNGWRVIYLGQNVPAAQLIESTAQLRPDLICVSVTTAKNLTALCQVSEALATLPEPRPRLAFGGLAVNADPEVRERFPDALIVDSARSLITALEAL